MQITNGPEIDEGDENDEVVVLELFRRGYTLMFQLI